MSWSKVQRRIWRDDRFQKELTKTNPSGQACFLFLLTAPESAAIPGVIPAGPRALSETLGWSETSFRRCVQELIDAGMARVDWDARLVWLPKAPKHNRPQSPNVVRAWRKAWAELPDCQLKKDIRTELEDFLKGFAKAFQEAFVDVFQNDKEQEEEKEEEQEKDTEALAPPTPIRKPRQPSRQQVFANWFEERRKVLLGDAWVEDSKPPASLLNKKLEWLKNVSEADAKAAALLYIGDPKRRGRTPPCELKWFAEDRAAYLAQVKARAGDEFGVRRATGTHDEPRC